MTDDDKALIIEAARAYERKSGEYHDAYASYDLASLIWRLPADETSFVTVDGITYGATNEDELVRIIPTDVIDLTPTTKAESH